MANRGWRVTFVPWSHGNTSLAGSHNYLTNWWSEKYDMKELRDSVAKDQIKCLIGGDIF